MLARILGGAMPAQDVEACCQTLLRHFGDYASVVSADPIALARMDHLTPAGVAALKLVDYAAERLAEGRLRQRDIISGWDKLLAYCRTKLSHRETEALIVLYLDRRNGLISAEVAQQGTVDHVPVYPREIARRALELHASAVILVHNHPSGDPSPSESDIAMTHRVLDALVALDITLHDHLVIGGQTSHLSFRSEGLL